MERRVKPEVMSPAGYWPQLHAAVEAGADSVYFGLHHFTARAKVGFSIAELPEAMRTLHQRGVRGFVTFNTLVFEHELATAARAIASIAEAGADAMIVQDVGIVKLAREIAPDLELHASTQMSITNAQGVMLARQLGLQRVTLARELSLEQIRRIADETGCELEIFVHGALCVAYSGQCFSSEAWGGRSANRGKCAQACRLPYSMIVDGRLEPLADARYLLSPGDLYALRQVPEIVDIGIAALKIEGRYKDADYVALTTRAYRQAVDEAWAGRPVQPSPEEELRLEQVYSRGLGPHFLTGTNHQTVVEGRAPRHRGVLAGRVSRIGPDFVTIEPGNVQLKPGDGLVFDAADWRSPQEHEEGGRIYSADPALDSDVELRFGKHAVDFTRIRAGDLVWRTHDPDLDRVVKPYLNATAPITRQRVEVTVVATEGEPLVSEWRVGDEQAIVRSQEALGRAATRPLTLDTLRGQLGRLGGTPYELGELRLETTGSPFAPMSVLNQMRREAVEALQELQARPPVRDIREPGSLRRSYNQHVSPAAAQPELHLLVRTPAQLAAAIECNPASITLDYLDLYGLRPSVERVKSANIRVRVASPRILKPGEARIVNFLRSLDCPILARSAGMIDELRGADIIGDFSLNAANSLSAAQFFELGVQRLTPTHDLNADQVAELARTCGADRIEVVGYQHLPVFHTEHCVFCRFLSKGTSYRDCGRPCEEHVVSLRDETGRAHPVMADVGCRNTVFGAEAQEASGHLDKWIAAGIRHFRLEFVHEGAREVGAVVKAFEAALNGRSGFEQLGRELKKISPGGTTEGSLFIPAGYRELVVLQ